MRDKKKKTNFLTRAYEVKNYILQVKHLSKYKLKLI